MTKRNTPKSFWTYQACEPTPTVNDLPAGTFNGTQDQWETLTPGMRREILRDANRRVALALSKAA